MGPTSAPFVSLVSLVDEFDETQENLKGYWQIGFVLDFKVRPMVAFLFAPIEEEARLTAVRGDFADKPGTVFRAVGAMVARQNLNSRHGAHRLFYLIQ